MALLAPSVCGVLAVGLLSTSSSAWQGLAGLGLAIAAGPLLPLAGAPLAGGVRLIAGLGASALLWLVIGRWAARRATCSPVASWPEWRREYVRLGLGAAVGGWAGLALGAAVLSVLAR